MIGKRVAFSTAYKKTIANKNRIFASTGKGGSGFERLCGEGFPAIAHAPKFKLDKAAPVFTIGSCFARNIESSLAKHKIGCLTSGCTISDSLYESTGLGARNGALNAYTPLSMLELIRFSSTPPPATLGALQVGQDEWIDMMMSGLRTVSGEELAAVRSKLYATYSLLPSAGSIIITLGYTESWYDTCDHIYVNRSPGGSRRSLRYGDRFEFHNVGAVDTLNALKTITDYVHSVAPSAKMIFTVSPIPIHGTFTDRDVVTANLYSKCTLLSAAVEVSSMYDFVDYFPSYEFVVFSHPQNVWREDGVHVRQPIVDKIVATFCEEYFS